MNTLLTPANLRRLRVDDKAVDVDELTSALRVGANGKDTGEVPSRRSGFIPSRQRMMSPSSPS